MNLKSGLNATDLVSFFVLSYQKLSPYLKLSFYLFFRRPFLHFPITVPCKFADPEALRCGWTVDYGQESVVLNNGYLNVL